MRTVWLKYFKYFKKIVHVIHIMMTSMFIISRLLIKEKVLMWWNMYIHKLLWVCVIMSCYVETSSQTHNYQNFINQTTHFYRNWSILISALKVRVSPSKQNSFYYLQWKPFKNYEKCILFHHKSFFLSPDTWFF